MAENSKIEWTDHTINLWWGCSKVHSGCDNCYAEYLSDIRYKNNLWGNNSFRKKINSFWSNLDKFQKQASEKNEFHKVFVGSMMDIFEKPMPLINSKSEKIDYTTNDLRNSLFSKISDGHYNNLIFLFLTKRPSNIVKYIPRNWLNVPPKNVWFGTSISDQETANKLIPQLLTVNGNKFLSVEPQLDCINIQGFLFNSKIDWVIQGGESGHAKRPFDLDWAYYLKQQCEATNTPYFFKQIDKIQSIPEDLQIRQFPKM